MAKMGGDGAYFREDIHKLVSVKMRAGTNVESGETHVILDLTLETGESYSYSLPLPQARELAQMLKRYVDEQDP